MEKKRRSRRSLYIAAAMVTLVFTLVIVEVASFALLNYFVVPRDRSAFYTVPDIDREKYEQYLADRHPVLGWVHTANPSNTLPDSSGSRLTPSFPEPGNECVSIYGDSFTYGEEVGDSEAWGNLLSTRLDCRVANFGVGAYGTDQAVIRFLDAANDSSNLVILGIYPHNVLRNVNQYRLFLSPSNQFSFKPRFVVSGDSLRRIPMPDLDYDVLMDALAAPGQSLDYETFLPDSAYGPITMSFPYTAVMLRYVTTDRVKYAIQGWPAWRGFVQNGHPSRAMEVTAGIVEQFAITAAERGKESLVVLFPSGSSYEAYQDTGEVAYQDLLDAIGWIGVPVVDFHEPIEEYLGERDFCELLTSPEGCYGHFNPEGNAVIANTIYETINQTARFDIVRKTEAD